MRRNEWKLLAGAGILLGMSSVAWARSSPMALNQEEGSTEITTETTTETTIETETTTSSLGTVKGIRIGEKEICFKIPCFETYDVPVRGYRGVDDFFWVREANPNVKACQWQIETKFAWATWKTGLRQDDDFMITPSVKYGITDQFNVEIEVLPINIGDGGKLENYAGSRDGMGDFALKAFYQIVAEQDLMPAIAVWGEMRVPGCAHSEKIDGTIHLNLTKTIHEKIRIHAEGFMRSANGARGDRDRDGPGDDDRGGRRDRWSRRGWGFGDDEGWYYVGDRRHLVCGLGAGFDYAINDCNLLVFNWLNKTSEYYGNSNTNILGAGWVYHINDCQQLMVGVDYADTHGYYEGPRWTGKAQWSIAF